MPKKEKFSQIRNTYTRDGANEPSLRNTVKILIMPLRSHPIGLNGQNNTEVRIRDHSNSFHI